jgi:hypothetical protein
MAAAAEPEVRPGYQRDQGLRRRGPDRLGDGRVDDPSRRRPADSERRSDVGAACRVSSWGSTAEPLGPGFRCDALACREERGGAC